MTLRCPGCGEGLSRFDVDEIGRCRFCGLTFTDENPPTEVAPAAPVLVSKKRSTARQFLRVLLIVVLVLLGLLILALALIFAECSRHPFRFN